MRVRACACVRACVRVRALLAHVFFKVFMIKLSNHTMFCVGAFSLFFVCDYDQTEQSYSVLRSQQSMEEVVESFIVLVCI